MYGDKCNHIDVRNIINLKVYLLFMAAGVLEDKVREKELVNVYIFQQPMLCLNQDDFKITQRDERKDWLKIILRAYSFKPDKPSEFRKR